MISGKYQQLSKEFILKSVTQEQIFELYLGVPIQAGLFINPLRKDEYPTCSFKYMGIIPDGRNLLWFRDFADAKGYDCFGLVQRMYNNCTFYEALELIALHFNLLDTTLKQELQYVIEPTIQAQLLKDYYKHKIGIKSIPFERKDVIYWNQYHLDIEDLEDDVKAIKCYWVNDNKFIPDIKNPNYAYDFENLDYKLYFPYADKKKEIKFLHNNSNIFQGENKLKFDKDLLLITSSYKDVKLLRKIELAHDLNYEATSPMSETTLPKEKLLNYKKLYKHVLLYHNNDKAGLQAMESQAKEFDLEFIFNPEGMPKDITDISKELGYETAVETIHNLLYQ